MYLSPETILFIREHRNDDVHSWHYKQKDILKWTCLWLSFR